MVNAFCVVIKTRLCGFRSAARLKWCCFCPKTPSFCFSGIRNVAQKYCKHPSVMVGCVTWRRRSYKDYKIITYFDIIILHGSRNIKFILFDSSFSADVTSMQKLEIQNNGASELIGSWSLHIYRIWCAISFLIDYFHITQPCFILWIKLRLDIFKRLSCKIKLRKINSPNFPGTLENVKY